MERQDKEANYERDSPQWKDAGVSRNIASLWLKIK